MSKKTVELSNVVTIDEVKLASVTVTAHVVNRSRTNVSNGTVVFDNAVDSCAVTFGSIQKLGGSAQGSCSLNGRALTVKATFTGENGSTWVGIAGDGTEFTDIDINLNDEKMK